MAAAMTTTPTLTPTPQAPSLELDLNVCALCEDRDVDALYKGLVKCRKCGYVWADASISDAELARIYEKNYFFGGEYKDYLSERPALVKDFENAFSRLDPFKKGGHLLEIGCAYGFSLEIGRERFDDVTGVDLNGEAVAYARRELGLDARQGDFLQMDLPENHYDAIVTWQTLEHLRAPHRYMEKIARLLKPGGVFACTTVDIDGIVPKLRGADWRQIHPPTHISYYSKKTLAKLVEKYGLSVRLLQYIGLNRTIDNMLYGIFVLIQKRPWIYNVFKKLGLNRGTLYLNLYDMVLIVAQKQPKA